MKDYSKVKFVKPSKYNSDGSFTLLNAYELYESIRYGFPTVLDDDGYEAYVKYPNFIPCDKNGNELSND